MTLMFEKILIYPIVLLIGYFATYYCVPFARKFAQRFRIMDIPAKGHLHKRIVARTGGIAIFIGFQISFLAVVLFFNNWPAGSGRIDFIWWGHYFLASLIVFSVGLIDDRYNLSPFIKLLGQITAAVLMFYFEVNVGKIFGLSLPFLLNLGLTVFWFVAIINAFNLIDGLDGLATGLALIGGLGIACALLFYNKPQDALVLAGFIGACFAFLRFNSNPARIFLGDSGSMFLGFTLAAISLTACTKGATVASIGVPLLAVGIPLFDTALAIWRRAIRKLLKTFQNDKKNILELNLKQDGIMQRDLEHLHHRVLRYGLNQKQAAWLLYCASSALVLVGLVAMMFSSHLVGIYLIAFIICLYIVIEHVARAEVIESGRLILTSLQKERTIFYLISPALDFILLTFALFLAIWIAKPELTSFELITFWLGHITLWCILPLAMEALFGTYVKIWSRARLNNFISLISILSAGIVFSFSLSITFFNVDSLSHSLVVQTLLYLFFANLFLVGLRSIPLIAQDALSDIDDNNKSGILIYGADTRAELYLLQRNLSALKNKKTNHILGLIDNDLSLKNKYIRGYKVLGDIKEISSLGKKFLLEKIIITKELAAEELNLLRKLANDFNVPLVNWLVEEKVVFQQNDRNVIYASNRFAVN